jgi:hypothetical protein
MLLKNNTCVIMQPTYLPWLGYFDLVANARDFIFLDDVKFNKSSYHHQNKILGVNGIILLSVPTHAKKGRMDSLINEVDIDNSIKWKKKHLMSIEQSYKKAPYFSEIYHHVQNVISSDILTLSDLNIKIIKLFSSVLSLNTKFYTASNLENLAQSKVERLVKFCQIQECNSYYSPVGSLDYLDTIENKALFSSNNIEVFFQNFELIPYNQKKLEFTPYMSILDALMYCGVEGTKAILEKSHNISKFK